MKKEKLELLLNKVVEYNNPKANKGKGSHFKAFLYKKVDRYYFKVVEIVNDDNIEFNDIIFLKDGDADLLIVAEKPKLMRVSKHSWHYKLLKYVLRSNAPTPQDMQNGCPYFWLLVFSMFVVPFIQLFKGAKWTLLLIPKMLFWVLEQMVNGWIAGLDDEAAYDMYWGGGDSKMPKTAKIYFNNSDDGFFDFFLSKKYKDLTKDDPQYEAKREEIQVKWKTWRADLDARRAIQREERQKIERENFKRKQELDRKRAEFKAKWDAKMLPFRVWRNNTAAWFRTTFTVERGRRNAIVKRTKQFVGAIVTLVVLAATFVVVNYIALGLMVAADAIINGGWIVFVGVAVAAAVIGILYLLYILISSMVSC